ncbi:MAG: type IV pilin protein [Pseudomonadota bacterium]
MNNLTRNMQRGMTLIELLVVVVIIGIIASIALPGYQESVAKARRSDAHANILELAQWMERYYTENGRYDQDRTGTAMVVPTGLATSPKGVAAADAFYNISVGTLAQQTFTITAAPANGHAGDKCANLTLTQAGVKGTSASGVDVATCW